MPDARARLERAALVALVAAAVASTGVAGWLPLAGLALAVGLLADKLGASVAPTLRALRRAGDVLVALTGVFAFVWTMYPVISEEALRRVSTPLAYALAAVALTALAGVREWPPARTLIPGSLALLLLGAQLAGPGPRFPASVAAYGSALALFLLCESSATDRRSLARRAGSLFAFLVAVILLGIGISIFLPWAQPLVEGATVGMIAEGPSSSYAGFSSTSRLGDIEELSLSRRVVLRAFSDIPQRLRGRVFTRFDGRAWAADPAREKTELRGVDAGTLPAPLPRFFDDVPGRVLADPRGEAPDAALVRTRIVQAAREIDTLLLPLAPRLVALARDGASLDENGIVTPSPAGALEIYAIANRYGGPAAGEATPELLQLPAAMDPRIVALAERLGGTNGTPEEKRRRTAYHLERCCRYSLKVPRSTSKDPVAGFLFETQRGYCEYFASAAALLLRLQGLPTRYVTGFNVRDDSRVGGHFVVRESDAHAWIESYEPGAGWLELDPTPSAQFAEVHAGANRGLAALFERVAALFGEIGARARSGSLLRSARWAARSLKPVALAGGLLAVALLLRRLRWRAGKGPARQAGVAEVDPRIVELLARVDALLRRHGQPRPSWRAPLEHLESLAPGALRPPLRDDLARALDCFYRARYGGQPPEPRELDGLLGRLPAA